MSSIPASHLVRLVDVNEGVVDCSIVCSAGGEHVLEEVASVLILLDPQVDRKIAAGAPKSGYLWTRRTLCSPAPGIT